MRRLPASVRRAPVLSPQPAGRTDAGDGPLMAEIHPRAGRRGHRGSGGGSGSGAGNGRRPGAGGRPRRRWWRGIAIAAGVVVLVAAGYIGWVLRDLPSLDELNRPATEPGITVLSADGTAIAVYGRLTGRQITVNDLPPALVEAVLATEDRRFYDHPGIDVFGIARAVVANLQAGRVVQGGSTITQQLAKMLFLTPEKSFERKLREAVMALRLEAVYDKNEILARYLNRAYFGAGAYGIDAAARRYFDRPVEDLDVGQSAMLAGLLQAPSAYAPTSAAARAERRMRAVLANLVDVGYLTADEARAVRVPKVAPSARATVGATNRRWFADWVLDQLASQIEPTTRDIVIRTSLNHGLQTAAEAAVSEVLTADGGKVKAGQGAFVAVAPDGGVLAMVGGRDYRTSQFNRATQAWRQPGSTFKVFAFLAALEAGWGPDSTVLDAPVTVDGWSPANFEPDYAGRVQLIDAAARSLNTATVRLAEEVGRDRVIATARRLGLSGDLPQGPSVTLGTGSENLLEMTAAYAVLANQGRPVVPWAIAEVTTADGTVLYRREAPEPADPVLSERTVQAMNAMLVRAVESGTGRAAQLRGAVVAGKTGTSQDYRDAWFIGYTGAVAAGVWVGNDDDSPMRGVTGGRLPAKIWARAMSEGGGRLMRTPPPVLPVRAPVMADAGTTTSDDPLSRLLRGLFGDDTAAPQAAGPKAAPAPRNDPAPRPQQPSLGNPPAYPGDDRFHP
ncbi:penicillin-binding protein 1A [Tistrella bauzanensis]|uniref:peptidoglycan glycosyltransferase n=2 Tax=Tistrella bauzanensis TaxID=657419 RepID=A0ABQ1J878_9PROT|nr:penicillin-binding protein 1A [Tistrella bauzanensis]